jgi:PAS domain S-box-containing protein
MGGRIRAHDWAASPLGAPDGWPQPLKTLVALMLASEQPMFMAWGAAQTWLYNDAFMPILGAKHPAALGRPALEEVWKEARDMLAPLFARVFSGEPVHMDDFGLMLDRRGLLEEAHFAFAYTPVRDDKGGVAGLFGACIETTERIRAQQKLSEADRRKDEFLATLAHELRNPLAPLRNALHLARARARDAGLDGLHGMMERQVDQMVRLVDDLMDVARITRGKLAVSLEPVEVAPLVGCAVEIAAPAARQAGADIRVTLPPSPLHVRGDAVRLTQVLSNLLNNAVKFSDRGQVIDLVVREEAGKVIFVVRDDGIGIPADKLDEIFEVFSQLDRSLERSRGGLGLGLALARQIALLHGGTLHARSDGPGRGSEFALSLPRLSSVARDAAHAGRAGASAGSARSILIADDNRDAADSMGMVLGAAGHQVEIVYNGLDAIAAARRLMPEVMLLDIGMPGMNGYEVARTARQEPWSAGTLVIALTGWGQEADRLRSAEAGVDVHLVKPVELVALQDAVLRRRSARP